MSNGKLPNFALGRKTGSLTITPQAVAADGTLTDATTSSILAQFKTARMLQKAVLENISATSSALENNQKLETGTAYEITGLLFDDDLLGARTNPLADIVNSADVLKVVHTRAGRIITYFGQVERYEEYTEGKGGILFTLQLRMVDIGSANPVFA